MSVTTTLARLRGPATTDVVQVSVTGTASAVTSLARALATVATITSMRHQPDGSDLIRLDVTCYPPTVARGGGR